MLFYYSRIPDSDAVAQVNLYRPFLEWEEEDTRRGDLLFSVQVWRVQGDATDLQG